MDDEQPPSRRRMLECMGWAGAGVLWTVSGGLASSVSLDTALAAPKPGKGFSFLQVSDSHIGFNKDPNPDARVTFREAVAKIKAMPAKPDFILHTGDVSHLSRDSEFDDADQILSEARHTAETTVADAKQRSDAMLSDAQTRSETQLRQAQEKADALQADAERKHSEIMGTINQQRTVLEGRLEQLRTFEREYRTRLKTYLESQLEELGQRGSAAPVDSGATTDGGGFNQFSRGNN